MVIPVSMARTEMVVVPRTRKQSVSQETTVTAGFVPEPMLSAGPVRQAPDLMGDAHVLRRNILSVSPAEA